MLRGEYHHERDRQPAAASVFDLPRSVWDFLFLAWITRTYQFHYAVDDGFGIFLFLAQIQY